MLTQYGELGKAIESEIRESAKGIIAELIAPVRVLKDFDAVEVLTLDEAARVLRRERENLRAACARGEVPHQRIGRDVIFPKRLLIAYLCGEWRPAETAEAKPAKAKSVADKVFNFVN